jgi:hypothetical protein
MDQKSSLHVIAEAATELRLLHQVYAQLQRWYSLVRRGNISDAILRTFPSKSSSEVQDQYLEELPERTMQTCTHINQTNDIMDEVDPPPAVYFKRYSKGHGALTLSSTLK